MTRTPSTIEEAIRWAAEDYCRRQFVRTHESPEDREKRETAAKRLAFYLGRALREATP